MSIGDWLETLKVNIYRWFEKHYLNKHVHIVHIVAKQMAIWMMIRSSKYVHIYD